jgi:hypothetical protein
VSVDTMIPWNLPLPTCLNLRGRDAQLASCYFGVHITPLVFNGLENHKTLRGRGNAVLNVGLLIPSQFLKLLTAFYTYTVFTLRKWAGMHGGLRINRPLFSLYFFFKLELLLTVVLN